MSDPNEDGNGRADCDTAEPCKKDYVDGWMSDQNVDKNDQAEFSTAEPSMTDYVEGGF